MILLDTSLWIEFLKKSRKYFFCVKELLESNQIITHECIFGELLQGARNEYEREIINGYWESVAKIHSEHIFVEAGRYSSENKLFAKGIGLIDAVLIVACKSAKVKLWSLDAKLNNILKESEKYVQK